MGFFALFLLDGLAYYAYTNNFFYKITATAICHNQGMPHLSAGEFMETTISSFLGTFTKGSFFLIPLHLGLPIMLIASLVDRQMRVFSFIGSFILLYLIFGSSSITDLIPLPFQARYFQPVIPFVAIALGVIVERYSFFASPVVHVVFPSLLACVLTFNGASEVFLRAGTEYNSNFMKSFRTAVEILADE